MSATAPPENDQSHVLIVVENLPVPPDYRVWTIAGTLRDAGWRVSVICPASESCPAGSFTIDGIHILRHSLPPEGRSLFHYAREYLAALWYELWLSLRVWRRARFHVIHACNPPDLIWIIGLMWRVRGVRFVYDHHDLCPELILAKAQCAKPSELPSIRRGLYRLMCLLERITHACAHMVLATNESYRQVSLARDHAAPECVRIVRTGPRIREVDALGNVPAASPIRPRIAYVGVMGAQDGVNGLLRAFNYLRNGLGCICELVLIGDGPERADLERLAHGLGLGDTATFKGFVPRDDMLQLLKSCAVGVTPDPPGPMNSASTMLKVLDYMVAGLPQVMYDLPENRVTADDAAAYAVAGDERDLAGRLAEVLTDDGLQARLRAAAAVRVRECTWESSGAPALLAAYQELESETS
jgi:glycosyltransferase involved in cell wall biosynthesis